MVDAINTLGGRGWGDEEYGFYYDRLSVEGRTVPLKVRSMVGLIPLLACEVLDNDVIDRLPGFKKRMMWFLEHRKDLARFISYAECKGHHGGRRLLAVPPRDNMLPLLQIMPHDNEILFP